MNGAELLVDTLARAGARRIFSLSGNQIMPVYDACIDARLSIVHVPIELTGEAEGVKVQGGLIDFVQREVAIACLPSEIPEHIQVDVSPLTIGQGVRLRELLEGASWEPVSDPDTLIVHVIAPRLEAEDEDEGEDAAEGEGEAEDEAASKAEG